MVKRWKADAYFAEGVGGGVGGLIGKSPNLVCGMYAQAGYFYCGGFECGNVDNAVFLLIRKRMKKCDCVVSHK